MEKDKKNTLEIRKILAEYSRKHVSIIECVSNVGPLTVELLLLYNAEKPDKRVYDTILIMITNYYVMLYMIMYTGFFAVSRNHTSNMVSTLVEEILKETTKKQKGLKSTEPKTAIQKSRYFTWQMVEVLYNKGIEDCHRFVASSVYLAFQSENKNSSVKRDWVENIVSAIQAEKFLTGSYEDAEFSF